MPQDGVAQDADPAQLPTAAERTTPEVRRGRSHWDALVVRFPGLFRRVTALLMRLPRSRLRDGLLSFGIARILGGFNRRDWELTTLAMDPDDYSYVAGDPNHVSIPGGREVWHGPEGFVEAMHVWLGAWEDFSVSLEDVIHVNPTRLVVLTRMAGRGAGSGVQLDQPLGDVFDIRRGKLVRDTWWWEHEAPLKHAGLDAGLADRQTRG